MHRSALQDTQGLKIFKNYALNWHLTQALYA